jgi:hypothetical protein
LNNIDIIIDKFETQKFKEKDSSKKQGIFYTPWKLVNFIVSNAFKLFFEEFFTNSKYSEMKFDSNLIKSLLNDNKSKQKKLKSQIKKIKILDPASGSGRFLISAAKHLHNIYNFIDGKNNNDYSIKKKIIQEHIYGIDIDEDANVIAKLRLAQWLYNDFSFIGSDIISSNLNLSEIKQSLSKLDVKFNLFNKDYLLNFDKFNFNIILGNPPYIENKKISDSQFKKKLSENFISAYKLFDLSVVFIEKSINILNPINGVLSFLTTNKFLAADYGIKIREIILKNTQIKEIVNISSLNSFRQISTYPIILLLKKGHISSNNLSIRKFKNLKHINNNRGNQVSSFSQEIVQNFPSFTIPLSKNVELIDNAYSKYKKLSEVLKDLRIIYRPFGFIDWVKNSSNIIENYTSPSDMILLGTGNVHRYHIDYAKEIKVAKKKYFHPYFRYNEQYRNIWKELSSEKLIFREIAKDLSFVYDPGVVVNLTGLYFVRVPSFTTEQLFGLLTILNSRILNTIFKSLYGTLHMSSGYLRFNGSFIKSIPIPEKIPSCFSYFGRILHFLSQLKFELIKDAHNSLFNNIKLNKIETLLEYYDNLTNKFVNHLYFQNPINRDLTTRLPNFNFKFIKKYYDNPSFKYYSNKEIKLILEDIFSFFLEFKEKRLDTQ